MKKAVANVHTKLTRFSLFHVRKMNPAYSFLFIEQTARPKNKDLINKAFDTVADIVKNIENYGLKLSEIKMIESVIEENTEVIAEHWNKFFNNNK